MKSKALVCHYCGNHAELRDAFVVYRRMGFGQVWFCPTNGCGAYVGVHAGTTKPKGSLANDALRELRKKVHAVFDPLWRDSPEVERSEVYKAAAQVLGKDEFHIGEMRDEDAQAYLAKHDILARHILLQVQHNRLDSLADASMGLIKAMRYLYVDSQRSARRVLSHNAYRGHVSNFKAAIDVGLVRRFKAAETSKVFYALTPAGCTAIGIPVQ